MLKKLHLENFKSWEKVDLELSNLTLLFGTNSSGKTSILSSLLLLKQTAIGSDRSQQINLGDGDRDIVFLGSYKDVVFNHDESNKIQIKLDWFPFSIEQTPTLFDIPINELTYDVTWRKIADRIIIDQLNYDVLSPNMEPVFLHMKWQENNQYQFDVPAKLKERKVSTIPLISNYAVPDFFGGYGLGYNLTHAFEEFVNRILYLGPLRDDPRRDYLWKGAAPQSIGKRGERTIEVLLASERNQSGLLAEVSKWLAKSGLTDSFQIKPIDNEGRYYETQIRVNPQQQEVSLTDVGFGISQVLPVITLLFFAPKGSIVLIEQPEIHLHPSAQARLADLFLYVAEKRNLQLIIESHSEHLLRRLQRRIAEQEQKLATPEHIKMYFCVSGPNGSTIETVKVDRFGQIANWPKNFFGDIDGDLEAMTRAALKHRRQELRAND